MIITRSAHTVSSPLKFGRLIFPSVLSGLIVGGALAFLITINASANDDGARLTDLQWLDPRSDRVKFLTEIQTEPTSYDPSKDWSLDIELGRIAFRSPTLLGGLAARRGLSCQTCHTNGRSNQQFFVAGLSSSPGTVDTTTALFSRVLGDGEFNPIKIPSLQDITETAPYGHDSREPSLAQFTHTVIESEFAGEKPCARIFGALMVYLSALRTDADIATLTQLDLSRDLTNLHRTARVLSTTLRQQDKETSLFVIAAMHNQLRRIAERFTIVQSAKPKAVLVGWSHQLKAVREAIDQAAYQEANLLFLSWQQKVEEEAVQLGEFEQVSLYAPDHLREFIAAYENR